jgi:hypothetical protein
MGFLTSNALNILLMLSSFFFALRVLRLYSHIRSPRLFLFGFAMLVISFTAVVDFAADFLTFLHIECVLFVGQALSLLFVLFSLLPAFDRHLHSLMRLQILTSILLLVLLAFSPLFPSSLSNSWLIFFYATRSIICFAIFFYYISTFFYKSTRFSLLMSLAFFLLSFGYLLTLPKYVLPDAWLTDIIGDVVRIVGVFVLTISFVIS